MFCFACPCAAEYGWCYFANLDAVMLGCLLSLLSYPCLPLCNICLFRVLAFKALFTLLMRNLLFSLVVIIMGLPSKKTIDKTKVSLWLGVFQVEDISVKNCRLDVMKENNPAGFVCQGRELSVCCQETVTLALIMINYIHMYMRRFFPHWLL